MKNKQAIMIIYVCMKIINIFLGPFLVAYFIKISTQTIVDLSIFNILNYMSLCFFGIIVGYVTERKHSLGAFRLGVALRFIYILMIMLLGSKITYHFGLIAFVYGFSSMFYHLPFNLYHTDCVENSERNDFEFKINAAKNLLSILVPFLLGAIITTTNYQLTAIIILMFSVTQIVSSFYLKALPTSDNKYDLFGALKKFIKDKQISKMLLADYLNGLTFSDGVLSTVITVLIMYSFKSDFKLGIINSITAILSLIIIYLYSKYYKGKDDKKIICISGLLIFFSMILLSLKLSNFTVILYNVIFEVLGVGLLTFIYGLRLFNLAKDKIADKEKTEYWVVRELSLNIGRVTGYLLLLIIGILGLKYLKYFLIILSLIVLGFTLCIAKINKNEF